MNLKNFKGIAEDENSYTVQHPSGKKLFIEKAKLSPEAHKAILCLYNGGSSGDGSSAAAAQSPAPDSIDPQERADSADRLGVTQYLPAIDAVQAQEGPVPGDAGVPDAVTPEQAAARAQAIQQGRGPDSENLNPVVEQKTGMQQLLQQEAGQQTEAMNAEQAAGKDVANVQESTGNKLNMIPSDYAVFAIHQDKDKALEQAFANKVIDPQHLLHSMSTGSKIATGIGMILSGMGSASSGQPNMAMGLLNKAIDNDILAQQNDQSKAMNLWQMNRANMKNEMDANLGSKNQLLAAAKFQLEAAQTRAALPVEKLRAQQAINQIQQQMLQNNMQRAMISGSNSPAGGGKPALSGMDPSILVPQFIQDPAQQKIAYEEIKNRANIARNGNAMLDAFEQATKDTSGVAGSVKSMLPNSLGFESPAVTKLIGLAMPNLSEVDGTIRQAAKDAFISSFVPRGTDNAAQVQGRRQGLQQWLRSQAESPVSKGASQGAIDLDRFSRTAMPVAPAQPAHPPQFKIVNGIKYMRGPKGEAIPVKK